MKQKPTLTDIIIFPALVLIVQVFAVYVINLYDLIPAFDIPMHFIGGMSIAYAGFYIIKRLQAEKKVGTIPPFITIVILTGLTALAAVGWEIMEYIGDQTVYHRAYFQPSQFDTMKDLLLGTTGGFIIGAMTRIKKRPGKT